VEVRNEENFSLRRNISLNYAKLSVLIFTFILTISIANFYLFKLIDSTTSSTAKKEKFINNQIIKLSVTVDSLEQEVAIKDSFIVQFKKIVSQ
jgi:hypothetical protein